MGVLFDFDPVDYVPIFFISTPLALPASFQKRCGDERHRVGSTVILVRSTENLGLVLRTSTKPHREQCLQRTCPAHRKALPTPRVERASSH